MFTALAALFIGAGVLAVAADQFVIGAARVALIKQVPALVVGIVVVGFGTSAPELLVSVLAVVGDEPEVAIGNIVGSNIANLSLLLGVGALLVPLAVDSRTVRREAMLVVAATVGFGLAVQGGGIGRIAGVGLLAAMVAVLVVVIRTSTDDPLGTDVIEFSDTTEHRLARETGRLVIGLAGTLGAAQLLLWGAIDLADRAGLSGGFVGATLVAVGTSLPELVTVVQSARRSETDLIVGNLLGSNLFNALVAGGVVGLIGGPRIDNQSLTAVAVIASIAVACLAALAMRSSYVVSRREGIILVAAYAVVVPLLM
ncbi:MAG: sodium:calcium antiporter [Ilumatobacteraceae bacterium]|nr:sodium:calcium antiporter [Ilumatobacteraceae bacterium]